MMPGPIGRRVPHRALVLAGRLAFGIAAALATTLAAAQSPPGGTEKAFPARAVRVTLPFSAGSGPDVFVRVLAEKLSRTWGQQVIVDARPGANGFIAFDAVKKAPADGHELLLVANSHMAINPALFKKLPYDPERDYAPVVLLFRNYFFFVVAANGPYQSVPALIAAARASTGTLSYGTPYIGSPPHLGSATFEFLTRTKMNHVPFKDTTQIFLSVANGDLTWAFGSVGSTAPIAKTGRLRLLAIGAPSRLPTHPDVPTLAEAGGPAELVVDAWSGLVVPRATPDAVVRKINADIVKQLGEPDILERLRVLGFDAAPTTPEGLAELIRSDRKRLGEVIRRIGASVE